MCQCQLSSVELASGAAIPPCAATVCERVGTTLLSTAVFRPARASSSAARMPEPPAPTTIASKRRVFSAILSAPQDLHRPAEIAGDHDDRDHLQREPQAIVLDVVHEYVAHADPRMPAEADGEEQRRDAHPAVAEERAPGAVVHRPAAHEDEQQDHGVDRQDDGWNALREPAPQAVMRADDDAVHHTRHAKAMVSRMLAAKTM